MARRLTITLDDELAARLEAEARRKGMPPEDVVSENLPRLLGGRATGADEPFVIDGPFLRPRPGIAFDDIEALLDEIEGSDRR